MDLLDTIWNLRPYPTLLLTESYNTNFRLFKNLVQQKKYEEAKAIADLSRNMFDYILFCAQSGSTEMIDFFVSKNISLNIEDATGKNILYILGQRSITPSVMQFYSNMSKYIHSKGYKSSKYRYLVSSSFKCDRK